MTTSEAPAPAPLALPPVLRGFPLLRARHAVVLELTRASWALAHLDRWDDADRAEALQDRVTLLSMTLASPWGEDGPPVPWSPAVFEVGAGFGSWE